MSVELLTGGKRYGGWLRLQASLSIEQLANGFELGVSEQWSGQAEPWLIRPGDECALLLDGESVITGYVDDTEINYDRQEHGVSIRGRDATGDLVDCAAVYKSGQWANKKLDAIARDLCQPFGIGVKVETDVGSAFASFKIEPGETAFETLDRAARLKAVLLISDGLGNLVITRAGTARTATALVEGQNILSASAQFSWKGRYSRITVTGHGKLDLDAEFASTHASPAATITDDAITRYRPHVVVAEDHGDRSRFLDRAEWEKTVRMGRGNRGSITVQGWTDAAGRVWRPNTLVSVTSPMLHLQDAEMLIVGCLFTLDESGTRTALSIARKEAFDLVTGIGRSKLFRKLNTKEERERKKKADDWSML